MAAIFQTIFSNVFSWMKMFEFRLRFHWSLPSKVQLTIFHHWFRWWLGAVQAPSHYLNQWWLVYRRIYASFGLDELIHVDENTDWIYVCACVFNLVQEMSLFYWFSQVYCLFYATRSCVQMSFGQRQGHVSGIHFIVSGCARPGFTSSDTKAA